MDWTRRSLREFNSYRDLLESFNAEELYRIARIKRFVECHAGDPEFRQKVQTDPDDAGLRARLEQIGVDIAPRELTPLWDCTQQPLEPSLFPATQEQQEQLISQRFDLERFPLVGLWIEFRLASNQLFRDGVSRILSVPQEPRLNAWRERRIASANSELGWFAKFIDHPLFAFELSRGCSVGCGFCAFSAHKLSAVFDYTPENRAFWRELVRVGVELFGTAAGVALCYYATEPHDNPHYLDFLKDYQEISGSMLCTATAAPVQDPAWLRSLIEFYRQGPHPWPRLSVLSVSMLHRIHETYSPDELRDCGTVMQMKSAQRLKASSGRMLHKTREELGSMQIPDDAPFIPQGSISCVSGFLVNLVDHTIQLISPCFASDEWPFGYRVFGETTFQDVADYRAALERMISTQITQHLPPDMVLAFRDDLQHSSTESGFTLLSPNKRHHLRGKAFYTRLGQLIASGDKTFAEIVDLLTADGAPLLEVSHSITKLFDKGLLDETRIALN